MISATHPGWHFGSLLAVLILGGGLLAFFMRERPEPLEVASAPHPTTNRSRADASVEADYVVIGGVRRRRRDLPRRDDFSPPKTDGQAADSLSDYGTTPPVATDANPQVASVVAAIREKKHPERISALIAPAPFDPAAYEKSPNTYLETIEPGRVFQTAQPGKDVPTIRRISPSLQRMQQGGSIHLEVEAVPEAPVTFTSFDLGRFENELTSITVQANDEGLATVEFFAPPGTIADVNILAGSPMTWGHVRFVVNVQLPTGPD